MMSDHLPPNLDNLAGTYTPGNTTKYLQYLICNVCPSYAQLFSGGGLVITISTIHYFLSTAARRRNPSIVETMVLLSAGHWPVYILRFYYEKPNTNIDEPMM